MSNSSSLKTSKFLSLVLRHKPDAAGISLDDAGWCPVHELLSGCARHGYKISREELEAVVAENDKKRFQFSEDGGSIRAVQGHSIYVNLGYVPSQPPDVLYHGTAVHFLDSIKQQGILKGSRQYVHLSASTEVAFTVGARHGTPVVIPVNAERMWNDRMEFYLAPNGVWLTGHVSAKYLLLSDLKFQ